MALKSFRRGTTLRTRATKGWTKEQVERNDLAEASMIFTDFHSFDDGKSRKLVCTINTSHPDYEFNAALIEKSPTLLFYLKQIFDARDKTTSTQDLFTVLQMIAKARKELEGTILFEK